ncbi:hypothetical protein Tco_0690564 [Tanacetum coccineum]
MSAQRSEVNALPNNEVPILENVIGQGSTNTRGRGRGRECSYKEFIGTKPTVYYRKGGPIVAMDWLRNIEICFETCRCPTYLKVRYATTLLQAAELHWWNGIRATHGIAQAAELPWK